MACRYDESRTTISAPQLNPPVANEDPTADVLTGYDQGHLVTYPRLLDADTADWIDVLHMDPAREPERAWVPGELARPSRRTTAPRYLAPVIRQRAQLRRPIAWYDRV